LATIDGVQSTAGEDGRSLPISMRLAERQFGRSLRGRLESSASNGTIHEKVRA